MSAVTVICKEGSKSPSEIKTRLTVKSWAFLHWLELGWPQTHISACFCLLSVKTKGVHLCTWLKCIYISFRTE